MTTKRPFFQNTYFFLRLESETLTKIEKNVANSTSAQSKANLSRLWFKLDFCLFPATYASLFCFSLSTSEDSPHFFLLRFSCQCSKFNFQQKRKSIRCTRKNILTSLPVQIFAQGGIQIFSSVQCSVQICAFDENQNLNIGKKLNQRNIEGFHLSCRIWTSCGMTNYIETLNSWSWH